MVTAHEAGRDVPGFDEAVREAVTSSVADQASTGIDIVNDGEQGRRTYVTYACERLTGFELGRSERKVPRELVEFPDFAELTVNAGRSETAPLLPACTGPISYRGTGPVTRDIAQLLEVATSGGIAADRLFMTAISPGTIAVFLDNKQYGTKEAYLGVLADAMHEEYREIVEAGLTLQIDCPDLAMRQGERLGTTVDEIRADVALSVEALNTAVAGLPAEQMRIHVCWGNLEAPHTHDVPLASIIDIVATACPAGLAVESANPRHGHEWTVFEEYVLPEDKYLLPGVIDTTTNFVEHPELVAERLRRYATLLGNERVIATTDCGFGTHAGWNRVARDVAWAKLRSMVEGAELASR